MAMIGDFVGAWPPLQYDISARRVDTHGSIAVCKDAEIALDTDPAGRGDAFNPAELFLAALAACMIKGIERVVPILKFQLDGVRVRIHGVRQDSPPKMTAITYELFVDTPEPDRRLELLHENVRRYLSHAGGVEGRRHTPGVETVALAVYMGGGPAVVYGGDALRAVDEYSAAA